MTRFTLLSLFVCSFAATTSRLAGQSLFEIRQVVDSLQTNAYNKVAERSPRGIILGKVVFTVADIDSTSVFAGSTQEGTPMYAVNVVFKESLNDSMRNLTAHSIGHRFAVVVNGNVLATPRILDPLRTARISISFATEAEARETAQKIREALKYIKR